MRKLSLAAALLCSLLAVPAHAQFGGLGKLVGGGAGDVDGVVKSGVGIMVCATMASDLTVAAANQMLDAFPDEAVAGIRDTFSKYNELKAKRGADEPLDGDSATLVSDGLHAMESLDVTSYRKAKAAVVRPAYMKMGLALGIDGLAVLQLPGFLKSASNTASSLKSNPMQAAKALKLLAFVKTGAVLVTTVPRQVTSIGIIRGIAKKIADAENIKLGEPASLTSLDPNAVQLAEKQEESQEAAG